MAKVKSFNPVAFTTMAVTFIVAIVYLAISIPLIILHETVPKAPSNPVLYNGLNTTEAWLDLATLTDGYHPYNSHRNDEVRDWLLKRIETILEENGVDWSTESTYNTAISVESNSVASTSARVSSPNVTIFNDLQSNVTCSAAGVISASNGKQPGQSVYFESTNIMVYIRGTEDEEGEWWKSESFLSSKTHGQGGVLVNAHYDSVSTGYGATDDGMGVITVLQLIRFFTTPGNTPKKGVVALLNNGEEDFLNGARAYTQHPISTFPHTFLNLEGAGAGGRAVLFRSTDTEVTRAYAKSPNPFGTVVAADGFKTGILRSGTDYSIFVDTLGLRGLDVAFWYPRARYHTNQDDAKHTTVNSLWHMLSASVSTMQALTSDTSTTFLGPRGDEAKGKVNNGRATDGVWFDLFGKTLAVMGLRSLFAWSLTLLIVSPLILLLISYLLIRHDKFYFFAISGSKDESSEVSGPVPLHGLRGAFRFPLALIVSGALTVGSALLVNKVNPLIVYSSHYAVWVMMLTLNFTVFWFLLRGADFIRPTALYRGYAYLWMFVLGWAALVAATVYEDRYQVASGYIFVFFESATFLATIVTLVELFALPTKESYSNFSREARIRRNDIDVLPNAEAVITPDPVEEPETDENAPLIRRSRASSNTTTFANYARRSLGSNTDPARDYVANKKDLPYGNEQLWSRKLPTWTWLVQFLLVAPFTLITIGQVGLLVIQGIVQTGADGSSLLMPPMLIAIFSILLILPLTPFLHRFTYHVPSFLFLVFIGTLVYSLVAFPFSANNRYKAYFQQSVNLETGQNVVIVAGLEDYVRTIIATVPSAAGQLITCNDDIPKRGLKFCSWTGLAPKVVSNIPGGVPPEKGYQDWLSYNVTRRSKDQNSARFVVEGRNTRACALRFDRPIRNFNVLGGSTDDRFEDVPEGGSSQIKLWHREWDKPWTVDVEWPVGDGKQAGEEGMEGKVVCLWSDFNTQGAIPALEEIKRFSPDWSAITKYSDALVEGWKPFVV